MSDAVSETEFSVIIPTYDRLNFLKACIESVRAQSLKPAEIIVVDDGSTDGTIEWVSKQPDCQLVTQANSGPGAARNAGAARARGEYLAFLDSDDIWLPWALSVFDQVVQQQSRPSLIFASFLDFSHAAELQDLASAASAEVSVHQDFYSTAGLGYFAGAGMMVIRRSDFLQSSGFAEDRLNAEDHDLAMRLGTEKGFVKIMAPTIVGHRIHDSNEMSSVDKSVGGLLRMIMREKSGAYPGGGAFASARQQIISHHCRPEIVSLIRSGHTKYARQLFGETFAWHLKLKRWKFLLAVSLMIARASLFPKKA